MYMYVIISKGPTYISVNYKVSLVKITCIYYCSISYTVFGKELVQLPVMHTDRHEPTLQHPSITSSNIFHHTDTCIALLYLHKYIS